MGEKQLQAMERYADRHSGGGAQFHRPQFSSHNYQSDIPSVASVYAGNVAPRAPYATEDSVNDAQPHNDLPNNVPLYHVTHYERPVNNPAEAPPSPIARAGASPNVPSASGSNRHHASTTQNWMSQHDSSMCKNRSDAPAGGLRPCSNEIKNLIENEPAPSACAPSVDTAPTGVNPHSSPIQGWHANYDSSLHQYRRKADEQASTVMATTGGQGRGSPSPKAKTGGVTAGGQDHKGDCKSLSESVPPAPWLSGFDSSLTTARVSSESRQDPQSQGFTSNAAQIMHGSE